MRVPRRLEITLVNQEGEGESKLQIAESIAKLVSLIAIPVVIAVAGWIINDKLTSKTVSKDYVEIAASILSKSDEAVNPALRDWAVDLLNQNSPIKFSPELENQLRSGQATLPSQVLDGTEAHKRALQYMAQGDYANAEKTLDEAYEANEKILGTLHPSTAATLMNYSLLLSRTGQLERAEELAEKAYEIFSHINGEDSIEAAQSILLLAEISERKGDLKRGAELREKANSNLRLTEPSKQNNKGRVGKPHPP